MAKICDSNVLFPLLKNVYHFRAWLRHLYVRTYDTTIHSTNSGPALRLPDNSLIDSELQQILTLQNSVRGVLDEPSLSLKWKEYRRNLTAGSAHVGHLYTVRLEACSNPVDKNDWHKLKELKEQFQERLLLIFGSLKEGSGCPSTLLRSPLPFPDINPYWKVERLANMWATTDCLGGTLSHAVFDNIGRDRLDITWQSRLTQLLDSATVSIDSEDILGRTVLYTACEHGLYKPVVELLARKAEVQLSTSLGVTPLHIAAASGHTSICNLLLQCSKPDINSRCRVNGWTPLCYAARHGHYDVVQLLLDHNGVDLNLCGDFERTPFHLAVLGRHLGVLKLSGAHDKVVRDTQDFDGYSALHHAVNDEFVEGFKYLLEVLRLDPNCRNLNRFTLLMLAVKIGAVDIVEILVDDPRTWFSVHDNHGETALTKTFNERIKQILRGAIERRWRAGWDIMTARIVEWRDLWLVPGKENILSYPSNWACLEDLMGFFEEKGVLSWAEASEDMWSEAEIKFGPKLLQRIPTII